jgi:hypothetical protein
VHPPMKKTTETAIEMAQNLRRRVRDPIMRWALIV